MKRRLRTSPGELRGQLIVLAVALWAVAIVNATTSTPFLRSGQVRGTDFVQFYTLGRLAASGQIKQFDDFDAIRRTQLDSVPASTGVWFPPVYGPQVPLLLAPLGHLSYGAALLVWVGLSATLYFLLCWTVIARTIVVKRYLVTALIGAAAFPAFWQLLQHGQLTIVALTLIVLAWLSLRGGRDWLAGALLGLLVYKPPLLLPMGAVLLCAGAWQMLIAAGVSAILEIALTGVWIGWDGLRRYALLTLHLPSMATMLFTKPQQSHGLKAFWAILVPSPTLALGLYAISAAGVILLAARLWRERSDPTWRMTVLVLAVSLAAPYLFVYDLTILAPVWIWLADWFLTRDVPANVGRVLYAGFLAPLAAPIVPFIHVQPSVLCLLFLLVALWRFRNATELVDVEPQPLGELRAGPART